MEKKEIRSNEEVRPKPCPPLMMAMEDEHTSAEAHLRRAHSTSAYKHYTTLIDQNIRYSPRIGKTFFDEANKQLLVANSTHVYTISFDPSSEVEFPSVKYHNADFVKLVALKRSPNRSQGNKKHEPYLGIMFNEYQIEFTNLKSRVSFTKTTPKESKQKILTFLWTAFHNIVLVTTSGVELYQYSTTHGMKLVKEIRLSIFSYIHSPEHQLLLCLTTDQTLQPFHFSGEGVISRMPKLSLSEFPGKLTSNTIQIFSVSQKTYVAILRPETECLVLFKLVYGASGHSLDKCDYELYIPRCQKLAIHVIDNLVVVHDITSELSYVYDIRLSSSTVARPLRPAIPNHREDVVYSSSWHFLPGDYALEMVSGKLFRLQVDLEAMMDHFMEKKILIPFLLRRANSSSLLIHEIRRSIQMRVSLSYLADIFDRVNLALSIYLKQQGNFGKKKGSSGLTPVPSSRGSKNSKPSSFSSFSLSSSSSSSSSSFSSSFSSSSSSSVVRRSFREDSFAKVENSRSTSPLTVALGPAKDGGLVLPENGDSLDDFVDKRTPKGDLVIDQTDMYSKVLFSDGDGLDSKFVVSVVVEYIRSLNFHHIIPSHFLYELVIDCCVRNKRFYQLHQFIQSHVVTDSVHVACQLLSLEKEYPPAYQLALDMFKRLSSHDQIIEVLLSRKDVLSALQIVRAHGIRTFSVVRFLDVALECEDPQQYYLVYKHFQKKRVLPKNKDQIPPQLMKYYDYFQKYFPGLFCFFR